MNNWQILNRVCFTMCINGIVGGTALSLSMIWHTHDNEFLFKTWGTMGVLFFASAATLVVSQGPIEPGDQPSPSSQTIYQGVHL